MKRKPSGGPPPPHAAAAAIQEQRRRSSGAPSSQPASSVPGAIAPSPITSPEGVRRFYILEVVEIIELMLLNKKKEFIETYHNKVNGAFAEQILNKLA